MGSILLDGCVVEPWAFVGAGTLVPPGKVVRAGTLVMGNPMRVVRHCTDKDREWIVHSWNAYVRRMGEYRARDQERARGDERDGG
jgi:carbonic anhydrase/acetyltransferase-like protein (isoleucine patch superfamily)